MTEGFEHNLIAYNKLKYAQAGRKEGRCILCGIRDGDTGIESLEIYRGEHFIITMNLYPYNPGHVMLFPLRHLEDVRELTSEEWDEYIRFQSLIMDVLEELFNTSSFNSGVNIGPDSGASIPHLHFHIVPRYRNELGVVEILAGAKILVEDPKITRSKLRKKIEEHLEK